MQIVEPGGFYLSPTQVNRICAALERFNERMDLIFPKESGRGEAGQSEEKGEIDVSKLIH
ncbi:MAG: hypothetical protein M1511_05895 [Deltaproteobacteria bacterium]|nr:hypothetical protein [Deltaproteobacteria bacterium]